MLRGAAHLAPVLRDSRPDVFAKISQEWFEPKAEQFWHDAEVTFVVAISLIAAFRWASQLWRWYWNRGKFRRGFYAHTAPRDSAQPEQSKSASA
jgi:hypothetical protein